MKKILMVILAFVGVTCSALAAPNEYKSGDFICARVDEVVSLNNSSKIWWTLDGNPYSYATIYFDTGKAEAHSECNYGEIVSTLQAKANDIEQLVFIGSADEQGDNKGYDNTDLAQRRIEYVKDLFGDEFGSQSFVAGSKNAKIYSLDPDNQEFRSVSVYVIWKLPTCDSETVSNIDDLQKSLQSYTGSEKKKISEIFTELNEICTKQGKSLAASDSEKYTKLLSELAQEVNAIKKANPTMVFNNNSDKKLALYVAYANLSQIRNNLGLTKSKWKNKEGNFNTARLASDSIAGVVLGTAGGLITSHLVKKGQVKNGFEDIRCTIGGQQVADWGDEFTVGIR